MGLYICKYLFEANQVIYYTLGKIGWTFPLANRTSKCDGGRERTEVSSTCVMRFCYSSADGPPMQLNSVTRTKLGQLAMSLQNPPQG